VVIEGNGDGYDTIYASVGYDIGGRFVEAATLTGAANVDLKGNSLDNILTGNAGNNVLKGLNGNDTLDGDAGNDRLAGGAGDDTYYVDSGADVVIEGNGDGYDTVYASVGYDIGGRFVEAATLTGATDVDLTGNSLDNVLTGNAGNNVLTGLSGNDTLNGGTGNDRLTGGAGNDLFFFDEAGESDADAITDFSITEDKIALDGSFFDQLGAAGVLADEAFSSDPNLVTGETRIIYDTETGSLSYDADGSGALLAIQFATLGESLNITSDNFVVL
jgi:Ca2+-binding RTX toxin-like protein